MTNHDTTPLRDRRYAEIAELRRVLPEPLLKQERSASRTCWHAYRFMGAMERTRQFAADYEDAFQTTFGMKCDMRPELGTKEFETLWRMRQAADSELIPYPLYLEVSLPPVRRQPPEKFSSPHLVFVGRQWGLPWRKRLVKVHAERCRWDLHRVAGMPEFHVSNYAGLSAQDFLRATLSDETKMHLAIQNARTFSIEHRIVPLKQVLGKLSEEDRREAVRRLKEEIALGQLTREIAPPARCAEIVESSYGWIEDRPV
jgi:hypothetical protein